MKTKKNGRHDIASGHDVLLVAFEEEENIGMRSIASFLIENGISTQIVPYESGKREEILGQIRSSKPKIVGFSLIFQRMLPDFLDLIYFLRKNGIRAHFTMGGHYPTLDPEGTLDYIPGLDTVIRHEGEETMLDLFRNCDHIEKLANVPGLAYRGEEGAVINPPRPLIEDLDSLPFIVRGDFPRKFRGMDMYSMTISRGCYYDCSFCSVQRFYGSAPGNKRRTRSPLNVALEMKQLYDRGGRIFNFKDDDFGMKSKSQSPWIREFVHQLKSMNIADDILWRISCRADEIEEGQLTQLKDVGLDTVYMGIEAGTDSDLITYNKHYKSDEVFEAIEILDRIDISYEYGFMLFNPYSTMESIGENLTFLARICDEGKLPLHFTKTLPYVGTAMEKRLKSEGRLMGDVAYPDYGYSDERIQLLENFIFNTFNDMLFSREGIVSLLQIAKFDMRTILKFHLDDFDVESYRKGIAMLTQRSNESTLETINKAFDFISDRNVEDVIGNWDILRFLSLQELNTQKRIKHDLLALLSQTDPNLIT